MHAHAVKAKISCGQKLGFVAAIEADFAEPLRQARTLRLSVMQFNPLHHFFLLGFFLIVCIILSRILVTLTLGVADKQSIPSPRGKVRTVTFSCSVML
jgi:hypothetical protein